MLPDSSSSVRLAPMVSPREIPMELPILSHIDRSGRREENTGGRIQEPGE
jgi:hypothetical protein